MLLHPHARRYCILFISIIQVCVATFAMSSRGGTESFVRCVRAARLFVYPDFVPPTDLLQPMVSNRLAHYLHWGYRDHEEVSELHCGWIFHGKCCRSIPNVSSAVLNVSVTAQPGAANRLTTWCKLDSLVTSTTDLSKVYPLTVKGSVDSFVLSSPYSWVHLPRY